MVPSGPPTPVGGAQPVAPSLLRTNSSQQPFSSLVPPHTQFNSNGSSSGNSNMGLMGNISNAMLFRSHSFGPGSGGRLSAPPVNVQQRGGVGGAVDVLGSSEHDPRSFTSSSGGSGRLHGQHFQNPSANQDHSQPQQLEGDFQQQQQFLRGGGSGNVGGAGPVKLEPQLGPTDQNGPPGPPQQHLQSARSLGAVKIEPQQLQSMRSLGAVKFEHQHSDSSLFLQQQQQQFLQISRQSSQAAAAQINLLQQQRMLQQQQILKTMPRTHLLQQLQQGAPGRPQGKPIVYEPGMCARRLTHYMYHQQHRPEDNNIEFWRKFVAEYFAPNAKKRWCVSLYGSGRQTTGVFPQDGWHCEICNRKPGRGFETTVEVLPRLFQIKYASGTLEELLYIDMPHEYQNASGQIVLDYAKAVQESVLEQLRVVREGQLRVVFSPDLKICSWEFCARRHEELIPRRLLISQVSQLGSVVQKYQNAAQNASSGLPAQDLQNTCNSFVASARQLAKALEVPLVNDLGYTKRYVRCLQISEVVNSMKDLIDYSKETGTGPMDSLINFPRRTSASSGLHAQQAQQPEEQQNVSQNPYHNGQNSIHAASMQLASASNGVTSVNNSHGAPSSTSMSATNVAGRLHQNSMNSRQENPMGCASSPYSGGNTVQMPSASSSNSLPPPQPNPSSPFLPSPTPSTSNNIATPTSHGGAQLNPSNTPANMSVVQPQSTQPHEADPTESQSSVQKILQEMMMSSRSNGVRALGNEMKGVSGITPALNGGSYLMGNGAVHHSTVTGAEFGSMGGIGSHSNSNGLRAAMANNSMSVNGRMGMNHTPQGPIPMNHQQQQQQDMGNRLLGGHRSANSFSNLQFDWKTSP